MNKKQDSTAREKAAQELEQAARDFADSQHQWMDPDWNRTVRKSGMAGFLAGVSYRDSHPAPTPQPSDLDKASAVVAEFHRRGNTGLTQLEHDIAQALAERGQSPERLGYEKGIEEAKNKCGACKGTGEIVYGYPINERDECPACTPIRALASYPEEAE